MHGHTIPLPVSHMHSPKFEAPVTLWMTRQVRKRPLEVFMAVIAGTVMHAQHMMLHSLMPSPCAFSRKWLSCND